MFRFLDDHFSSLFLSALLAVVLSWLAPGCRVGNSQVNQENPDKITGLYQSHPTFLKFCVAYFQEDEEGNIQKCQEIATLDIPSRIPDFLAQFMSNPVGFLLDTNDSTLAYIVDPQVGALLPVYYDEDSREMELVGETDSTPFWGDDASCLYKFSITTQGVLHYDPENAETIADQKTQGSLEVDFLGQESLEGDCESATLNTQTCYTDLTQCLGDSETERDAHQQQLRDLYLPYIVSGAMEASQISKVKSLGYEVSYE